MLILTTNGWVLKIGILAPKLRIPKTQFTDHMKLKKKDDQSVGALILLRRGNKILRKY